MTPIASAWMGCASLEPSSTAAPIIDRFRSTGVNAGTANLRQVFSTPDAKATSDMQMM